MKQETVEEASEWLNKKFNGKGVEVKIIDWGFNEKYNYPPTKLLEEYSKWQQERSYSDEAKQDLREHPLTPDECFKQTLEEVAVRLVKETTLYGSQEATIGSDARSYFETELRCVLMGMNWQQERSYSEEEVLNKLTHFAVEIQRQNKEGVFPLRIKEWFERNKKK